MEEEKRKIFFKKKFLEDIEKIFEYIAKDSPKSANNFVKCVEQQIEKIKSHPKAYSQIDIKNFPNKKGEYRFAHFFKTFKILYKIPKDLIVFLGIVHDKQRNIILKDYIKKDIVIEGIKIFNISEFDLKVV